MGRLAVLLGGSLLVIACSGAPAAQPTGTPAAAPTLTPLPTVAPATAAPTAPSATQAPSASAGGGGAGTVGDQIAVGDYQFITLAEAEYTSDGYSDLFKPQAGNVIYAFLFEFEGVDPDGSSYNPLYFDLEVDGVEFKTSFLGGKEPVLSSGSLQPGQTADGWISFQAPLADEVRLTYEPVLGLAGNAVEWVVTVIQ